MRSIDDIEKLIKKTLSDRSEEIAKINQIIAEQEAFKEAATRDKSAATETGDLDAFRILDQQLRDADSAITFYSSRLRIIENKKNVSVEDTQKVDADLMALQKKSNADFKKEVIPAVDNLRKIINKYRDINQRLLTGYTTWHNHVSGTPVPVDLHKSWYFTRLDSDMRKFDGALKYVNE